MSSTLPYVVITEICYKNGPTDGKGMRITAALAFVMGFVTGMIGWEDMERPTAGKLAMITTEIARRWGCCLTLTVAHFQCTKMVRDMVVSMPDYPVSTVGWQAFGAKGMCQFKGATTRMLRRVITEASPQHIFW